MDLMVVEFSTKARPTAFDTFDLTIISKISKVDIWWYRVCVGQ